MVEPQAHFSNTTALVKMTSYSKAGSVASIVTTDTINQAIGKLEYGYESKASKVMFTSLTITATWTGASAPYTQDVTVTGMMSNSRKQPLPMARHAYCYLCRYYPETKVTLSDEAIAGVIDKDHSTAQHGYKTVEAYLQTNDKEFMGMWEKTISNLKNE